MQLEQRLTVFGAKILLRKRHKMDVQERSADHSQDMNMDVVSQNVDTGSSPDTNSGSSNSSNSRQEMRLMITHIVNEFFKSYAGTQVLGPFHKVSIIYICSKLIQNQYRGINTQHI